MDIKSIADSIQEGHAHGELEGVMAKRSSSSVPSKTEAESKWPGCKLQVTRSDAAYDMFVLILQEKPSCQYS